MVNVGVGQNNRMEAARTDQFLKWKSPVADFRRETTLMKAEVDEDIDSVVGE